MLTHPPCFDEQTNTDCPRRYIGCCADCKEWHEWLIIHAEEKEKFRNDLNKNGEAYKFMEDHNKRLRVDRARRSAKKRKL